MIGVDRVATDARQQPFHLLHYKGPKGVTEGSRRRSFRVGPVTAAPAGKGQPVKPATEAALR